MSGQTDTGPVEMCHCGQPLHYTDFEVEMKVRAIIAEQGQFVRVTVGGRTWNVPRHFLALHGLKGWQVADLGFEEVQ